MARHVYTGSYFPIRIFGDREVGERHINDARQYAGLLFDQLAIEQPGQLVINKARWFNLRDGTRIWCQVWRDMQGERAHARIYSPSATSLEGSRDLYDVGLLNWSVFSPFHPLKVWTGDRFREYAKPQDWNGDWYASPVWATSSPEIEYPDYSLAYYVALEMWPSRWSGLARLAMQGKHATRLSGGSGAGSHPQDLFQSWPDPNKHGILRGNSGRYWSIQIQSSTGFTAQPLIVPDSNPAAKSAWKKLGAGTYRDETEQNLLEAMVLGAAIVDPDRAPESIGAPSMLATVMATGSPLGHSWKFARGKMEFSIVTHRTIEVPEYPGYEYWLEVFNAFTFTTEETQDVDGIWHLTSLTMTNPYVEETCRPRAGWTNIWHPVGNGASGFFYFCLTAESPYWQYAPVKDNVVPIYCFYDKIDRLQIVWYYQHWFEYSEINIQEEDNSTPTSRWKNDIRGWSGPMSGGFKIAQARPNHAEFDETWGWRQDKKSRRLITVTGSVTKFPINAAADAPNIQLYFCGGGGVMDWQYANTWGTLKAEYNVGSQYEEYTEQTFEWFPGQWACIIDFDDAEAVHIIRNNGAEVEGARTKAAATASSTSSGMPILAGGVTLTGYRVPDLTGTLTPPDCIPSDMNMGLAYNAGVLGYVGSIMFHGTPLSPDTDAITTNLTKSRTFHSPHGTMTLPIDGNWSEFFPESIDGALPLGLQSNAIISYGGDGLVYTADAAPSIIGGYKFQPGLEAFFYGGA
jgi:hypothetical protein